MFNCLKKAMYKVEGLAATGQASCGTPSAVPSSHHKHSSHWVLSVSQESKSYKTLKIIKTGVSHRFSDIISQSGEVKLTVDIIKKLSQHGFLRFFTRNTKTPFTSVIAQSEMLITLLQCRK